MNRFSKSTLVALCLAFAAGAAHADGDGGDNSMSQWTGESYAAFNVGDFPATSTLAQDATDESKESYAVASLASESPRYPSPFRDDTGA